MSSRGASSSIYTSFGRDIYFPAAFSLRREQKSGALIAAPGAGVRLRFADAVVAPSKVRPPDPSWGKALPRPLTAVHTAVATAGVTALIGWDTR